VAGQYTLFDFVLRDAAKNTPQDYAYVWVRIVHADETLLAAGIHHQILGPTTFLYEFTAAGEYALAVSYRNKDDEEIASSTFPMSVAGHSGAQSGAYALYLFMAIGEALLAQSQRSFLSVEKMYDARAKAFDCASGCRRDRLWGIQLTYTLG
jgi:hypothetical protein